jgi:hypothetical protein
LNEFSAVDVVPSWSAPSSGFVVGWVFGGGGKRCGLGGSSWNECGSSESVPSAVLDQCCGYLYRCHQKFNARYRHHRCPSDDNFHAGSGIEHGYVVERNDLVNPVNFCNFCNLFDFFDFCNFCNFCNLFNVFKVDASEDGARRCGAQRDFGVVGRAGDGWRSVSLFGATSNRSTQNLGAHRS